MKDVQWAQKLWSNCYLFTSMLPRCWNMNKFGEMSFFKWFPEKYRDFPVFLLKILQWFGPWFFRKDATNKRQAWSELTFPSPDCLNFLQAAWNHARYFFYKSWKIPGLCMEIFCRITMQPSLFELKLKTIPLLRRSEHFVFTRKFLM